MKTMKKYEFGGPKPIKVSSKTDPRYIAYKDSLDLRNNGINTYRKLAEEKLHKLTGNGLLNEKEKAAYLASMDNNIIVNPNRINPKIKPVGYAPFDPNNPQYKVAMYAPVNQEVKYAPKTIPTTVSYQDQMIPYDNPTAFKGVANHVASEPEFGSPNSKFSSTPQNNNESYDQYVRRLHNDRMKYEVGKKKEYGGYTIDPLKSKQIDPKSLISKFGDIDIAKVQWPPVTASEEGTGDLASGIASGVQAVSTINDTIGKVGNAAATAASRGLDMANTVLGSIDNARVKREEQAKLAQSLLKRPSDNMYQQGINNVPVYTQYGGDPAKLSTGKETSWARKQYNKFLSNTPIGQEIQKQWPTDADKGSALTEVGSMALRGPYGIGMAVANTAIDLVDLNPQNQMDLTANGLNTIFPKKYKNLGRLIGVGTDVLNLQPPDKTKQQFGGEPNANVEAEDGEILERTNGQILQVDGDRHEQGGEDFANVSRVLEDTAGKRKDELSKALVIDKDTAKTIIGKPVSKGMSHAQVFEKASKEIAKKQAKYIVNIDAVENMKAPSIYSINSAKLNSEFGNKLPTSGTLFDTLFNHQEQVKQQYDNFQQDKAKAKYGIGPIKPYNRAKNGPFSMKAGEAVNYGDTTGLNVNGLPVTLSPEEQEQAMAYQLYQTEQAKMPQIGNPVFTPEQLQKYEMAPKTEVPTSSQAQMDLSPKPFALTDAITSKLDNPLSWTDTIGPTMGLVNAMTRDPELYNSVKFNKVKYALQDVRPILNNNQGEYNAAKANLSNSSIGNAQAAQLFANKLKADNQAIGQYENQNKQILNQEIGQNQEIDSKQQLADANSRQSYSDRIQTAKAKQVEAKQNAMEQLALNVSKHEAFNQNSRLLMKLAPNFDQNAEYNGRKYEVVNNGNNPSNISTKPPGTSLYKVTNKDGKVTTEYLNDQEYQLRLRNKQFSSITRQK